MRRCHIYALLTEGSVACMSEAIHDSRNLKRNSPKLHILKALLALQPVLKFGFISWEKYQHLNHLLQLRGARSGLMTGYLRLGGPGEGELLC